VEQQQGICHSDVRKNLLPSTAFPSLVFPSTASPAAVFQSLGLPDAQQRSPQQGTSSALEYVQQEQQGTLDLCIFQS
jgi:hypothetical protein